MGLHPWPICVLLPLLCVAAFLSDVARRIQSALEMANQAAFYILYVVVQQSIRSPCPENRSANPDWMPCPSVGRLPVIVGMA